jgi:hypothetical protein
MAAQTYGQAALDDVSYLGWNKSILLANNIPVNENF